MGVLAVMAVNLIMQRRGRGLMAVDGSSFDKLMKINPDEQISVKITRPRNIKHHRKLFGLLGFVIREAEMILDEEELLEIIKQGVNYGKWIEFKNRKVWIPGSISFDGADQTKFEAFYDQAIKFIIEYIMPGVDREDFEARFYEILDGNGATYTEPRR